MLVLAMALGTSSVLAQAEERRVDPAAAALMTGEFAARGTWENFPGLTAHLVVTADGQRAETSLQVDADGTVHVQTPAGEQFQWLERALDSLVGHRLTHSEPITNVQFADDQVHHPHGRLIRSIDPQDTSLWRVQGDALTEVQRIGEKTRFIISVADVFRNAENKHLPQNFIVTTWENATGQIKSVRQVHNEWTRVGAFDLPVRHLAITNRPDGSSVAHQIEFSEYKLSHSTAQAR
jgi:hypothetical protein